MEMPNVNILVYNGDISLFTTLQCEDSYCILHLKCFVQTSNYFSYDFMFLLTFIYIILLFYHRNVNRSMKHRHKHNTTRTWRYVIFKNLGHRHGRGYVNFLIYIINIYNI
ncbi:unnamed protein product [Musa textilis]